MVYEFKLPDIGEGLHEAEILQVYVQEGEKVVEGQKLLEILTDKATADLPSPRSGIIRKIAVKKGEVHKVGTVLLVIEEEGETSKAPEEKTLFDLPSDLSASLGKRAKAPPSPPTAPPSPSRVVAAPAVRALARRLGVDIESIQGTGPQGRITTEDVERAASSKKPPAEPPLLVEGEERVPLSGLRRIIYENMARSESYAVPFTYWDSVDVTELVRLRKEAERVAEEMGVKLTYLPFIVKACVQGLKRFPDVNAWVDETTRDLIRKKTYDIGVAVATDRGLLVVVLRNADRKSIFDLARELEELSTKAREGRASPTDLKGSTFTITSLGKAGGLGATPVINHPEVAIVGVHRIEKRGVVGEDGKSIVVRDVMNLSGTFDHRYIDGHVAAEFLQTVKRFLETPTLLLLGTT